MPAHPLSETVNRYATRASIQRFPRPRAGVPEAEWVTHVPFVSQIQAGVTKLWPSAETFTDLYQRLQRGSGQAVSDWVTRASATLLRLSVTPPS